MASPATRRILDKLDLARASRPATFGSSAHDFQLGPPLAEAVVARTEERLGVRLPAAYRTFLLEVGDGGPGPRGGAGPFYGLCPLAEAVDLALEVLDVETVPADWWRRPSPLQPGTGELPDVLRRSRELDDDDPAYLEAVTALLGGLIGLGTHGGTYESALVVSGAQVGRVAYVDVSFLDPPVLTWDDDFLCWYERWLDEALAGRGARAFGLGTADDQGEVSRRQGSRM